MLKNIVIPRLTAVRLACQTDDCQAGAKPLLTFSFKIEVNYSPVVISNNKKVIPSRLERETYCLEGSCSIQLSYGTGMNNFE